MPARVLVGGVASETAFKQLAPGRRVLHLATHGFFLGDECDSLPASRTTRAVGGVVGAEPPAPPRPRRASGGPAHPTSSREF